MTRPGVTDISRVYTLTNFSTFFVFALYFNWDVDRRARKVFAANAALEAERAKTEELLYNVLPQEVGGAAEGGRGGGRQLLRPDRVFVDLAGFSTLAKRLSPGHLVKLLNAFFSAADRCAERHGLEKVKTIGDAYLAVAGGMASRGARQQGGDPVRARPDRRAGDDRRRRRGIAAAGADRHPYRPGGRRRDRQQPARLRLLGRHDEHRQPAAGRRAAERRRGLGGDLFPDPDDPGL